MKDEFTESAAENTSPPVESQLFGIGQEPQQVAERLGRMEAALELVLDHLQSQTEGTQILEIEHSHSMLSSIALGISAVSLIALWSIATIYPDIATGILRFTIGMSLIFLAAVVDLASASILRRAVGRAMLAKDPSRLVFGRGPWYRPFLPGYWARIKREVPDFFHHQIARYSALAIYLVALAFLIWAAVLL
ncbi:hypothetical protein M1O12_01775 [Dehalococcoidia bacterium]|nr:hypothetical protein [Dehalococcoidia bacterium]